jgi:hypothetical protein
LILCKKEFLWRGEAPFVFLPGRPVVLSGIIYHFFDLDIVEYLPKYQFCIFKIITKKPCPGCGISRAFLSIGKFELLKAKVPEFFKYKSIQIAVLFILILIWIFRLKLLISFPCG